MTSTAPQVETKGKNDMEKHLNVSIKKVIAEFPAVGVILDEYQIGCVTCQVGTCLLKDIVTIHNLSSDQEGELISRIAAIVAPGQKISTAGVRSKVTPPPKTASYSPSIRKLVDEHSLIKRWLALIPWVIEHLDLESEKGRQLVLDGVDFIRSYADQYHHAKEEDVLFRYFGEGTDVIKAMLEDHKTGRNHVKAILDAVAQRDAATVALHLDAYRKLLSDHIKREDEILYPWMERNLSIKQIGELFAKFQAIDEISDVRKQEGLVNKVEAEAKESLGHK